MAELFYKQGQPARALAIYRKLVAVRPDDQALRSRLAELRAELQPNTGEAMGFHEQIERIVKETPGAKASVIMGFDGIPIDTFEESPGEIDVNTLLIEYSAAAVQLKRTAGEINVAGPLTEMTVAAEKLVALVRPLTDEMFLALVMDSNGLIGKGRFLMRIAAPELVKELS